MSAKSPKEWKRDCLGYKMKALQFFKILILISALTLSGDCKKPEQPPLKITLSSEGFLTEGKIKYDADRLMDGYISPWCAKPGKGKPSFQISYNQEMKFDQLHIMNGYGKRDLFDKNSRVAKFLISTEKGESVTVSLKDERESVVPLGKTLTGNQFNFTVEDVYKGSKYEDICISEISFDPKDFPGSIYYNAHCNFLNEPFQKIIIKDSSYLVILTQNGKIDGQRAHSSQIQISSYIDGKWKIEKDERGDIALDGSFTHTLEEAADDSLENSNPGTKTREEKDTFYYSLESNRQCTMLGDRQIKVLAEKEADIVYEEKSGEPDYFFIIK